MMPPQSAKKARRRISSTLPVIMKAARCPDHHDETDDDFLQGLDAEGVEDDLKEGRERAQKNAVEFSFHDVGGAEFVEIQRKNIEEAEGNEREAIEKDDFFHAPIGKGRNSR